jgi:hypothetical protein
MKRPMWCWPRSGVPRVCGAGICVIPSLTEAISERRLGTAGCGQRPAPDSIRSRPLVVLYAQELCARTQPLADRQASWSPSRS